MAGCDPKRDGANPKTLDAIKFGCVAVNGAATVVKLSSDDPSSGTFPSFSGADSLKKVDSLRLNECSGVGLERREEEFWRMSSDSPCSVFELRLPPVTGEFLANSSLMSSVNAQEKSGGVEKSDSEFNAYPPFIYSFWSSEDETSSASGELLRNTVYSVNSPRDFIKDSNFTDSGFNQGTLGYDPSVNDTPNPAEISNPLMPNFHSFPGRNAQISSPYAQISSSYAQISSPYAQVSSGPERIGAMMSGLSLGGLSSSSNGLALSAGSARTSALRDQMGLYAPAGSGLGGLGPGPVMSGLSSAASSSSSHGLNPLETNFNAGRFGGFLDFNGFSRYVLNLARTETGLPKLMRMMSNGGNRRNTDLILAAVVTDVFTFMTCEPGFELFTNLLKFCDLPQKESLLARILSDSSSLILCSTSCYGSRALIELVDHLKGSGLVPGLPWILSMEIQPLVLDHFSSSVVKHCLDNLSPDQCQPLYGALIKCTPSLAFHKHSCTLLYSLINNVKGRERSHLLRILTGRSVQLAFHGSGNYVLSHLLKLNDFWVTMEISSFLFGHYKTLAKDKHGSHVVEKCIQSEGISYVMTEFLKHSSSQELEEIACHEFGNYVIKMALITTELYGLECHEELVGALLPCLGRLEDSPFGKVVYKLLKQETECKNRRSKKQYRH